MYGDLYIVWGETWILRDLFFRKVEVLFPRSTVVRYYYMPAQRLGTRVIKLQHSLNLSSVLQACLLQSDYKTAASVAAVILGTQVGTCGFVGYSMHECITILSSSC